MASRAQVAGNMPAWAPAGTRGVEYRIVDGHTELRFRNDGDLGPSKTSGKTIGVANTGGNVTLPNGITVGLNAYRKP